MSDFRIDQITNQAGTAGPNIAGITTFSSTSGLLMPRGDTFRWMIVDNVVKDGLVLYLDAGNDLSYPGSGTLWRDFSGFGNNGTLVNGPTYSSANGGSLSFDGTNDKVISSSNIGISGDFNATLSVWVNLLELSTGYRCVCMFGSTGTMEGFSIFSNTYGAGSVSIGFYGGQNAHTAASTISANTWFNIVATKTSGAVSSNNTKLYINGISQNLTYATSLTPNAINNIVIIGNDPADEVSNNMKVSNLLVYNRALTAAEIAQNFNALRSRYSI